MALQNKLQIAVQHAMRFVFVAVGAYGVTKQIANYFCETYSHTWE